MAVTTPSKRVRSQAEMPGRVASAASIACSLARVVALDLVEPCTQVGEAVLVGREHFVGLEGPRAGQRFEVVAQRVDVLLAVERDVRGDAGQDVVA